MCFFFFVAFMCLITSSLKNFMADGVHAKGHNSFIETG